MPSAPACAGQPRRAHRIGMAAAARVADGGDVVDVHAEPQSAFMAGTPRGRQPAVAGACSTAVASEIAIGDTAQ